jgi:hypothetical protein
MINAYYLAYFNIDTLEGNTYINAIILGFAEVFSNFSSGLLLLKFKEDVAMRICCLIGFVATLAMPYMTTQAMIYTLLFFSVGGLGGMANSFFVVVELQVAPDKLGSVM